MVVYKCKKCGFMDINIGIQAHLVRNKCGNGEGYNLKESNLEDYTTSMTDNEYAKVLKKVSEDAIAKREKERKGDPVKEGEFYHKEKGDKFKPELVTDDSTVDKPRKG